MNSYWLTLGILTVWRVTHFLQAEDGPWGMVVRLRRCAGDGFLGELLDCFYCLSLWISAPAALWLGVDWGERIFLWLALSAGAILLERITSRPVVIAPPAQYREDPEHVLLRPTQTTNPADDSAPPAR